MNKDQVKGAVKSAVGKAQQKVGEVTGNTNQQVKGVVKQVEGKMQRQVGNAEQVIKDANHKP